MRERKHARVSISRAILAVTNGIFGEARRKSSSARAERSAPASIEPLEGRILFDYIPNTCIPTGGTSYYTPTLPSVCTTCTCTQQPIQTAAPADGGNPAAPAISSGSVRYFDGQPQVDVTDLSSDGFGMPWGQTRSYDDSGSSYATGQQANGNRWDIVSAPHIVESTAGSLATLIVVSSGMDTRFYDLAGDGVTYVPRDSVTDQLTYNSTTKMYSVTDSTGGVTTFYGFDSSVPALKQGQFAQYTDVAGNVTLATYAASGDPSVPVGRLETVTRHNASSTATETWQYLYTSTASTANISEVQWFQNGSATATRQEVYAYYDGTTAGGVGQILARGGGSILGAS